MLDRKIIETTNRIFSISYEESEENVLTECTEIAQNLIKLYEWPLVFECWNDYLRNKCTCDIEVINFINLFYIYCDLDVSLPTYFDIYDFLGYIYAKVDLEKNWDKYGNLLDSFCNCILENAGYIDLILDPGYQFWKDKKIINASEKYQER